VAYVKAQFLIERACPDPFPSSMETQQQEIATYGPLCVWVDLNSRPVLPCGGRAYHIDCDRGAINAAGKAFKVEPLDAPSPLVHYRPSVCEHMGHLIE
jgi:hypothetical protein